MKTRKTSDGGDARCNKPNVGIIPHLFIDKTDKFHLDDLIALLNPLTNRIFVITGGLGSQEHGASGRETVLYRNSTRGVEIVPINARMRTSLAFKAFEQVRAQLRILRILFRLHEEIDVLIFFLGGIEYAEHFVFARLFNIRCFVVLSGLGSATRIQPLKESGDPRQFGELVRLRVNAMLERLSFRLANNIIVYNESIIDQAKLRKYRKKIIVAHRHFVNFDQYSLNNDIEQRNNVVTYIGRLHEEKGVLNLVEAIPQVLRKHDDVRFVIIGDGHLEGEIRDYVKRNSLDSNVKLTGWIPHEELPDYYAAAKLLVLPSYAEGLPHVVLEAMACGTPVLATPVGAVPQVIEDKETGFLVHDNSPTCLADNIVAALEYPTLKQIVVRARNLVEHEFRYERVLETWNSVICDAGQ